MITDRPGVSSTMSAAALAASLAPDTAIPQSACFNAGASLTPSPVIPTIWPRRCRTSTMWNLCSGNTCAKPPALSTDSINAVDSFFCPSTKSSAPRMSPTSPTFTAVSFAMANASPVTIFMLTPIWRAAVIVDAASGRGGSNRGSTPRNRHGPSASARATPNERKPRAANSLTTRVISAVTCGTSAHIARITWGAPLLTWNRAPSAASAAASVRLCTGSNGWKRVTW